MHDTILSVSEFIALLNQTLEFAYPEVVIEAEVSSFKISKDKFVFFDLKDQESTVNCFMMVYQLSTPLEDGMRVRVRAQPKLTKWGRFSLTVRSVAPAGEGSLKRAFELLRKKLEAEGLFAAERKRPLPEYPVKIGVVSSEQAAGFSDFKKIIDQRWSGVEIQLADVQVQGDKAPEQIIAAIEHFNQTSEPPDVIALVRGGGSLDDLQAFNNEQVVRAVAGSRSPIVVGVGHETDLSLADLAADVRAVTPSNAAQLIVPERTEFLSQLREAALQLRAGLEKPKRMYQDLAGRLVSAGDLFVQRADNFSEKLDSELLKLFSMSNKVIDSNFEKLESTMKLLNSHNPKSIMSRGYSVVRDNSKKVVKSQKQVSSGDNVVIELHDGEIKAGVR